MRPVLVAQRQFATIIATKAHTLAHTLACQIARLSEDESSSR